MNPFTRGIGLGIFQGATSEHGLLGVIEGNSAELLPVADQLVLDNNFVNSEFTLGNHQLSFVLKSSI